MTSPQKRAFQTALFALRNRGFTRLHHGDCIGADAEAHEVARALQFFVTLHPPENASKRAFCKADEVCPVKPYLDRNQDIVFFSQVLLATPGEMVEQLRSGTWATIRYARKLGRKGLVISPDGSIAPLLGSFPLGAE